jgi:hypothetical protein
MGLDLLGNHVESVQMSKQVKVLKVTFKIVLAVLFSAGLIFHGDFRFLTGFDGSYTKRVSNFSVRYPSESMMYAHISRLLVSRQNTVLVYGSREDEGGYTIQGPTLIIMSNGHVHIAHGVFIDRKHQTVTPF